MEKQLKEAGPATKRVAQLQAKLSEIETQLTNALDDRNALSKKHHTETVAIKKEADEAKKRAEAIEAKLITARADVAEFKAKAASLMEELEELRSKAPPTPAKGKQAPMSPESPKLLKQFEALQQKYIEAQERIAEMEELKNDSISFSKFADSESQLHRVRDELAQLEETHNAYIQQSKQKEESLHSEIVALKAGMSAMQTSTLGTDAVEQELAKLKIKAAHAEEKAEALEGEAYAAGVKVTDLEGALEDLQRRYDALKARNERLVEDLRIASETEEKLLHQGVELKSTNVAASQEALKVAAVLQQLQLTNAEKETLEKLAVERASEAATLRTKVAELQAELRSRDKDASEAASPSISSRAIGHYHHSGPSNASMMETEEKLDAMTRQLNAERCARQADASRYEKRLAILQKRIAEHGRDGTDSISSIPSVATSAATERTKARKMAESEVERLRRQLQNEMVPIARFHALKVENDKLRDQKRRMQAAMDNQDPWRSASMVRKEFSTPRPFVDPMELAEETVPKSHYDALQRNLQMVLGERDKLQGKVRLLEENNSATPTKDTLVPLDKYNTILRQNERLTERVEQLEASSNGRSKPDDIEMREKLLEAKNKEADARHAQMQMKNDVETLQKQMRDKDILIDELRKSLKESGDELEDLTTQYDDIKAQLASMKDAATPSFSGDFVSLQQKYIAAQEKIAEMDELCNATISLEKFASVETELHRTQDQLRQAKQEHEAYVAKSKQLQQSLQDQVDSMESAIKVMRGSTTGSDQLENQMAKLKVQLGEAKEQIAQLENENFALEVKVSDAERYAEEAAEMADKAKEDADAQLQHVKGEADRRIEVINAEHSAEMKKLHSRIEALLEEIESWKEETQSLKQQLAMEMTSRDAPKVPKADSDLDASVRSTVEEDKKPATSALSLEAEQLRRRVEELEGENFQLDVDREDAKEAARHLTEEVAELKTKLKDYQAEVESRVSAEQPSTPPATSDSAQSPMKGSAEEEDVVKLSHDEMTELQNKLNSNDATIRQMNDEIVKLRAENEKLKTQSHTATGAPSEATAPQPAAVPTVSAAAVTPAGGKRRIRRRRGRNLLDGDSDEEPQLGGTSAPKDEEPRQEERELPDNSINAKPPVDEKNNSNTDVAMAEMELKLKNYAAESSRLQEDIKAIEDQLSSKEAEVEQLRKENGALQDEVNTLAQQREEAEKKYEQAHDQLEIEKAGSRPRTPTPPPHVTGITPEIARRIDGLEKDKKRLTDELKQIQAQLEVADERAQAATDQLRCQMDYVEQYQDEVKRLKAKAKGEDPEDEFIPQDRIKLPERKKGSKSPMPSSNANSEVAALQKKIEALEKIKTALENRLQGRDGSDLEMLRQMQEQASEADRRVSKAEKAAQVYKDRLEQRNAEFKRIFADIKPLKTKLAAHAAILDRLGLQYPFPEELAAATMLRLSALKKHSDSSPAVDEVSGPSLTPTPGDSSSRPPRSPTTKPSPSTSPSVQPITFTDPATPTDRPKLGPSSRPAGKAASSSAPRRSPQPVAQRRPPQQAPVPAAPPTPASTGEDDDIR